MWAKSRLTLYFYSANCFGAINSSYGKIANPTGTVTETPEGISVYLVGSNICIIKKTDLPRVDGGMPIPTGVTVENTPHENIPLVCFG